MPQFSVIVPVYNAEATLGDTLVSIAAQSYEHYEVVIINDGSTDRSADVALRWIADHPHITAKVISQANGGLAHARNEGIKYASNEWVALLDADDLWQRDKLEVVAHCITTNQADLYYHPVKTFGSQVSRVRQAHEVKGLKDLLVKGNPIIPSTVVARKSMFVTFPFDESAALRFAEDLDLWIRLLHANKKFYLIQAPLTQYRDTGGISSRIDSHYKCVMAVLEKYHQKEWYPGKLLQKAKHRKWYEAARFYHKSGDFKKASEYYAKSRLYTPKVLVLRFLNFLRKPL